MCLRLKLKWAKGRNIEICKWKYENVDSKAFTKGCYLLPNDLPKYWTNGDVIMKQSGTSQNPVRFFRLTSKRSPPSIGIFVYCSTLYRKAVFIAESQTHLISWPFCPDILLLYFYFLFLFSTSWNLFLPTHWDHCKCRGRGRHWAGNHRKRPRKNSKRLHVIDQRSSAKRVLWILSQWIERA